MENTINEIALEMQKEGILGVTVKNDQISFNVNQINKNEAFKIRHPEAIAPILFRMLSNLLIELNNLNAMAGPKELGLATRHKIYNTESVLSVHYKKGKYVLESKKQDGEIRTQELLEVSVTELVEDFFKKDDRKARLIDRLSKNDV